MNNLNKFLFGSSVIYGAGVVGMFGKLNHEFINPMIVDMVNNDEPSISNSAAYLGSYVFLSAAFSPFIAIPSLFWPVVLIHRSIQSDKSINS